MKSAQNPVHVDGKVIGWVSCSPDGSSDPLLELVLKQSYARERQIQADREVIRANPELLEGVKTGLEHFRPTLTSNRAFGPFLLIVDSNLRSFVLIVSKVAKYFDTNVVYLGSLL
jgi:hypothetical protein